MTRPHNTHPPYIAPVTVAPIKRGMSHSIIFACADFATAQLRGSRIGKAFRGPRFSHARGSSHELEL